MKPDKKLEHLEYLKDTYESLVEEFPTNQHYKRVLMVVTQQWVNYVIKIGRLNETQH